jgi:hypothetical protein
VLLVSLSIVRLKLPYIVDTFYIFSLNLKYTIIFTSSNLSRDAVSERELIMLSHPGLVGVIVMGKMQRFEVVSFVRLAVHEVQSVGREPEQVRQLESHDLHSNVEVSRYLPSSQVRH